MQIVCEGHPQIDWVSQGFEFIQTRPTILPEPVLSGESDADGTGVSIYGSVIRDGGLFRMWYQAWPKDWDVDFKLHAPYGTIVEGRYHKGEFQELNITPAQRRKDLVLPEPAS